MAHYIDKDALVAEIKRYKHKADERLKIKGRTLAEDLKDSALQNLCGNLLHFIDTLEVKVDLGNGIQLTWEDIRELYIIFAEVDVEIELCKSDNIKSETIGYYQEVLKRFKTK